jgi:hypothetical protein
MTFSGFLQDIVRRSVPWHQSLFKLDVFMHSHYILPVLSGGQSLFGKGRLSKLHYFEVRHSDGNKGCGKLLIAERHDQPPDHVAPSGFDKSIGVGIAASG